jgi:hypothetical protein
MATKTNTPRWSDVKTRFVDFSALAEYVGDD